MPLYKTLEVNTSTTVYIWKIQESENELSKDLVLTEKSSARLHRMKSEMHRKGFLSIRHLMAVAGYVDTDMFYDEMGKLQIFKHSSKLLYKRSKTWDQNDMSQSNFD